MPKGGQIIMKMKKLISLLLAGVMTFSLAACGDTTASSTDNSNAGETKAPVASVEETATEDVVSKALANGDKLVVWTLAKDLEQFADRYTEKTGVPTEVIVIEPADYPTKLQTAIMGGEKEPDIVVGEPQMLPEFFDNGFFADLDALGASNYAGQIVDYVWEVGKDSEGTTRAISYQITPAGFYYRRDIAESVFGSSDPEEVQKIFSSYENILEAGRKLKEAGYRIFASDSELNYFSGDSAWVVDGKLNVDQARFDYMDMVVKLYQEDLTAYAAQWSTPWYQAMSGAVPVLTADLQWGDWGTDEEGNTNLNIWDAENYNANVGNYTDTYAEVFAFGLPAWGVLTMRDNVGDTAGKWGVCAGPAYGFGGGTFIGISELSERKELAWDFVKFCTLNEETADWWIEASEGDTVSLLSALEKHKDDTNPIYGGEKMYAMWLELAKGIDYSKVTKYDTAIGDAWGNAISKIKTGEASKEDALNEFYDTVESTFAGEIVVER